MSTLDDLRAKGLIDSVEADSVVASQWLDDPQRHLEAADTIADIDPSGAYVLAYDAARKSIAASLLMTGNRVRGRPGPHQALAQYAKHLADPDRRAGGLLTNRSAELLPVEHDKDSPHHGEDRWDRQREPPPEDCP